MVFSIKNIKLSLFKNFKNQNSIHSLINEIMGETMLGKPSCIIYEKCIMELIK